jgi:CBS domain containing-hemolysin-like protein
MFATFILFYPFVTALNAMGNFFLRLVGIDRKEETGDHVYSAEELQIIVEESSEGGAMRMESGTILRELLEFGDRTAGEAMVPRVRVVGIPLNADSCTSPRNRPRKPSHALSHLRRRSRSHRRHAAREGSAATHPGT